MNTKKILLTIQNIKLGTSSSDQVCPSTTDHDKQIIITFPLFLMHFAILLT